MSNDNFQWTDELVLMIADLAHHNGYHKNKQRVVELFDEVKKQASGSGYKFSDWINNHLRKQADELSDKIVYATPGKDAYDSPNLNKFTNDEPGQWAKPRPEEVKQKDWEIVAYQSREGSIWTRNMSKLWEVHNNKVDGFVYNDFEISNWEGIKIHSVKRKQDGIVFTVGDETDRGVINYFTLAGEKQTLVIDCGEGVNRGAWSISCLDKSPQPKQKERNKALCINEIGKDKCDARDWESSYHLRVHGVISEDKFLPIMSAIDRILNNEPTSCQAIPDAALEELWEAIDHWKNKYRDLKK